MKYCLSVELETCGSHFLPPLTHDVAKEVRKVRQTYSASFQGNAAGHWRSSQSAALLPV